MKILHIMRSEPDDFVRGLVRRMQNNGSTRQVELYKGKVDYDRLVKDIFDAEKVICWW